MSTKSITISSEKGGAGKSTLTVNIATVMASNTQKLVLVVDADLTNQSTTRQLLPSMKLPSMAELEKKKMIMTTEKVMQGLLKNKTHIIDQHEILNPVELANHLLDNTKPVCQNIYRYFPLTNKEMLKSMTIEDMDTRLLSDALANGLTECLYSKDLFMPVLDKNAPALVHDIPDELLTALKNEEMETNSTFRTKTNKKILCELFKDYLIVDHGLTPAEAFGKIGINAKPRTSLDTSTLSVLPSKGRYNTDFRYQPSTAINEMREINDGLLATFDYVIYDSEATTNVLKSILLKIEEMEIISVVTPSNLKIELDRLKIYQQDTHIRGIIINNALPEHINELIAVVKEYNMPLVGIIPNDMDNQLPYLQHENKLIVGTGSNIDYAIRIAALNIMNNITMHPEDIAKIFTDASKVYDNLDKRLNDPSYKKKKNDQTATTEISTSKKSNFFSKLLTKKPVADEV
jgi:cellulose biosynthesis protein BcsQ